MSVVSNASKVKIILEDNGNIVVSQTYPSFLKKPSPEFQSVLYGNSLLDILVEESYISEDLTLRQITTGNRDADATRLIGSIAESLVVKMCNQYPEVNRTLGMYARFGERRHHILDQYVAVATGSQRTKRCYAQFYNPNDTQRDIIWVHKDRVEEQLLCLPNSSPSSAKPAGLQIKASHNADYVLSTIENYHYPILYFDLNNDWHRLNRAIARLNIQATLLHPDEISHNLKEILQGYFDVIKSILNREITPQRVIELAKYEYGYDEVLSGLTAAELSNDSKIILPSQLRDHQ